MTAVKYFIAWCKKNNIVNFIPLVFIIPIFTVLILNIFDFMGDNYNNYKFIKNSNYGSYSIFGNRREAKEDYYLKLSSYMFVDYLPEISTDDNRKYDNWFYTNFFFADDVNLLKTSFFTEANLLSGQYPKDNEEAGLLPDGSIPIYISYDASKYLNCDVGDKAYVSVVERYQTIGPPYKTIFLTLEFTVVGILRPYSIRFTDEYIFPHIALAFVNSQTIEEISKCADDQIHYIKFTDIILDENNTTRVRDKDLERVLFNFDDNKTAVFIRSTVIYVIIVVLMEISFIKRKRESDLRILRMLGLSKFNAKLSILLIAAYIMGIGLICSMLIMKYFYINFVIIKYYDWIYLLSIVGIVYLVILLTSIVYLAVIRIDSNKFMFKFIQKILKSRLKHLYKGDK